jgi:SWI/SNF-related matrix-associated actin-dependent regulator of chromatin subfamily A-like protein 1
MLASLEDGEAVLQFPYDEWLRGMLRAIPGRRWDPRARAWCVPLDGDQAAALAYLFSGLSEAPEVSPKLARELARETMRIEREPLIIDLARPDDDWWLSFATDRAPELVGELLEHPCSYSLPAIGRALIPLDDEAVALVGRLTDSEQGVRLSARCANAITDLSRDTAAGPRHQELRHEAELRSDSRRKNWVMLSAEHAPLARVLAERAGLAALDGPAGTLGVPASESRALEISELISTLEPASIDPRLQSWLDRASRWDGTVEVAGGPEQPIFLLLGDERRLPRVLRELAEGSRGGAGIPLTLENGQLIETHLEGRLNGAARRCVAALKDGRPAPPAVLECSAAHVEDTFVLAPGHEARLIELFDRIAGILPRKAPRRGEHEHAQLPAIRADPFCVPELDRFLATHEVWIAPDALELLQEIREQHARAAGIVALSAADEADLEVPGLIGELKPFQRAGVRYLLAQRRAFLADEQGLGKTIEAIAALESDHAYPAIILCPASLKLNWLAELSSWIPHRTVNVVNGRGGEPLSACDVTIVNYDIVATRLAELCAVSPRALVLDESHYCKNSRAKRTRAVQSLASSVSRDALVLALTGTPVMNNPPELISQLRIIGRLSDFGSGAAFSRRFKGADAHMRLHWHLRARCFARRLKRDVLPQLPAKTRGIVPIELDNEAEYRLAEDDLIAWLRSQPLDLGEMKARVAAALRAERLVRLNALKLLAARGKLHAALAWIHDFQATGEPLVVFARHREIQRAVIERFPHALHILGQDSATARDRAVRAFQDQDPEARDSRLIVCSMEVAGQGLTLTRASNVAFLELDWTPAKHDQAEDRCHRIGQENAVNAYYLLAAETVDETIATLLERKRMVIAAVTDGRAQDEQQVIDALVSELRGRPYRHLRAVA